MAELATLEIAEQLGVTAADRLQHVDVPGQYLITGEHDVAPNRIGSIDGGYACWLAPRRRLAVTATKPIGFASDISHGMAVFTINAGQDKDFLAMGCTLPPAMLAEGHCAQTIFAGLKLLLYRRRGLLHLHVERPLAAHLLLWFRQTATAL
jgi:hypothetical protein